VKTEWLMGEGKKRKNTFLVDELFILVQVLITKRKKKKKQKKGRKKEKRLNYV